MKTIAYPCRLGAFGLALVLVACGRSPTTPSASSTTTARVTSPTTFTIINGWSRDPVVGATVTATGGDLLTDAAGQVHLPAAPGSCLTITVRAAAFLDRRTCGLAEAPQITLWPVANADESDATRKWIFRNDQILAAYWSTQTKVALGPAVATRPGVAETWRAAADAIDAVSQGRIRFEWVTSAPEEGAVIEAADTPPSCSAAPWPLEIGGFCVQYDPNVYYLDRLQVSPDRLTDRGTALRALLTEAGIRTHSLSGVMNMTRPESDFSEFERKTLGMLGIRPRTVNWPDYDQIQ